MPLEEALAKLDILDPKENISYRKLAEKNIVVAAQR
jgi:hypothetical protein